MTRIVRAVRTGAVCIYGLTEPDAPWNIRYIGKVEQKPGETTAQSIRRRLSGHLSEARTRQGKVYRKIAWLRHLMNEGLEPGFIVLDLADMQTWEALERWHIASHRAAGFDLVNEADGGQGSPGYVFSEEQRWLMSEERRSRVLTPQHMAKLRDHVASIAAKRRTATRCQRGHLLTPDNLVPLKSGRRRCKQCHNMRRRQVTQRENARQGRTTLLPPSLRTHCPQGHEYTPENTSIGPNGGRSCRICKQQHSRESYERKVGRKLDGPILPRPELRTQCPYGHPYTPENTIVRPNGSRACRECCRQANRDAYRKNAEAEGKAVQPAPGLRTHCPQGHPYDEQNTYIDPRGRRQCRACRRAAAQRFRDRS